MRNGSFGVQYCNRRSLVRGPADVTINRASVSVALAVPCFHVALKLFFIRLERDVIDVLI